MGRDDNIDLETKNSDPETLAASDLSLEDAVADGLLPEVGVQRGHYQALAEDPVITVRTGEQNWLLQYNRGVQYRCTEQILQYVTSVQRCTVLFITVNYRFKECVITVQYGCTEVYRTCAQNWL